MVQLLVSWLVLAAGLFVASRLLDGMSIRGGFVDVMVVAALFGVLHFFTYWLIFVVLGVSTLGLGFVFATVTRLVADAIVLKIADAFSSRLTVRSFGVAFVAAAILALVGAAADWAALRLG